MIYDRQFAFIICWEKLDFALCSSLKLSNSISDLLNSCVYKFSNSWKNSKRIVKLVSRILFVSFPFVKLNSLFWLPPLHLFFEDFTGRKCIFPTLLPDEISSFVCGFSKFLPHIFSRCLFNSLSPPSTYFSAR